MSAQRGPVSVVDATYLGFSIQRHADRVGAHLLYGSPGAGEQLVGPPANKNAPARW